MRFVKIAITVAALTIPLNQIAFAQDPTTAAKDATDQDTAYLKDIDARATKIVGTLNLTDEAAAKRVHELVKNQYRDLRMVHDPRDAALKAAKGDEAKTKSIQEEADAKIKVLHDAYHANLAKDLSPEQVDKVKDGMTSNKVNVTYNAYLDQIPTLKDEEKVMIKDLLVQAREIAMDQGSSKEKDNVFGKYKGRIVNNLAKAGYDLKAEEKAWQERLKARRSAATQPAN